MGLPIVMTIKKINKKAKNYLLQYLSKEKSFEKEKLKESMKIFLPRWKAQEGIHHPIIMQM
jgi:hypothetical protein